MGTVSFSFRPKCIRAILFNHFAMRWFEYEFALHLLNKIQIADRDGFRPTSNTLRWSDPTLAFSSELRLRNGESVRRKVMSC